MSLRRKILILITLTLLGLIILLFTTSQLILLGSYRQLEAQSTRQNVQRVLNAINDEIAGLNATAGDWAPWDETYAFIQDRNQDYIDVNLVDSVYTNLSLNLMLFINTDNELVYSQAFDLLNEQEAPLPSDIGDYIAAGSPLLNHPDEQSSVTGILPLAEGTLIFASRPILTSEVQGPIRGTLIFARYLDAGQIAQLSETTALSITAYPVNDPQLPDDFRRALAALSPDSPVFVEPLDAQSVAGYAVMNDIYGNPTLALRVDMPRDIYQQGQASVSYFILALLLIGVVFGAVTLLLLDRMVVARLANLSGSVKRVGASSDLSARVPVVGSDELASLATQINQMLGALEQSQQTLRESEQRLRTVVDNAPIVLWSLDAGQVFTLAQGKGLRTLELEPDEIVGKTASELEGKVPQIEADIQRALQGEEAASVVGIQRFSFDTRFTPLRGPNGEINGVIGVATDITERLRAESALGETTVTLEQRNRQMSRAQEYFRVTLTQLTDAVRRAAPREELLNYLQDVDVEFGRLR